MKKLIILLAFVMQIFAQDLIKVGMSPGFAPFGYMKDGKAYGFDIDLVNEIAKVLDIKVEFVPMDFDALMGAVKLGKIDVIASGLSNTPARAKNVEFSDIYYTGSNCFLRLKSRTDIKDLNNLVVGVQLGSIQAAMLNEIPSAKPFLNSEISNLILALVNGKIDAVIVDKLVARGYLNTYKEIEIFKDIQEKGGTSFAFAKGNIKLRDDFNKALEIVKSQGIYEKLLEKYEM
ncbi:substrate-binding periplasmic protein [Campylobacter sp. RM12637]|uniref:substrate-binding periplasmic protein n=1 Tax=Campylobacter sp. RM12637 TaxID=2735734 RepID=UPI003014DF66|nr:amino acid ABC transporter substrate-binding protein [Campylobacter sp. RM12637]